MQETPQPVKPGYKTTEFWVTLLIQLVGMVALIQPNWITPEQSDALTQAITQLGGLVAMVAAAFGYNLSRGAVKAMNF